MEEIEITEVPLSNREVLNVLKARNSTNEKHHPKTIEMIEYLESIEKNRDYKYPLEILRDIKTSKGIDVDLVTLAVVSNISDLNILTSNDKQKIESHFSKKTINHS